MSTAYERGRGDRCERSEVSRHSRNISRLEGQGEQVRVERSKVRGGAHSTQYSPLPEAT